MERTFTIGVLPLELPENAVFRITEIIKLSNKPNLLKQAFPHLGNMAILKGEICA